MLAAFVLSAALAGAPAPRALRSTVRLDPDRNAFAVDGTWRFAGEGRITYRVAPEVDVTFDAPSGPGWVEVPPSGRVAFRATGRVDRAGENFVTASSALLNGVTFQFYPGFGGDVDTVTCVEAPAAWVVRATGDATAEDGCFRAEASRWFLVAGRRDGIARRRGPVGVVVDRASTAEPLLAALERITAEQERWYGPRPSATLTVVEVPFDGGFSGIGLIVIHPGAVAAFVEGDAEGAFLAHEVAHQWFGGVLNSSDAIREGLATYTALRYERARSKERGEAYRVQLIANEARARPGRTIRDIRRAHGWRDYEAVGYARSALVFDRLRVEIGDDALDALLHAWVRTSTSGLPPPTEAMSFEALLAPLSEIKPEFDRDEFIEAKVRSDWDPATNAVRPFAWVLDGWVAALLIVCVAALARRYRLLELMLAAGVAATLARSAWVYGWPVALGAAVVLALAYGPERGKRLRAVGYGVALLAWIMTIY